MVKTMIKTTELIVALFCVFLAVFAPAPGVSAQTAADVDIFGIPTNWGCSKSAIFQPILSVAYGQKGYYGASNKFNNYNGESWCADFASWVYQQSGAYNDAQTNKTRFPKTSNARELLEFMTRLSQVAPRYYYSQTYDINNPNERIIADAIPGDIIVWKRVNNEPFGHAGIVVSNDPCKRIIHTIEGNVNGRVQEFAYTYAGVVTRFPMYGDNPSHNLVLYGFGGVYNTN